MTEGVVLSIWAQAFGMRSYITIGDAGAPAVTPHVRRAVVFSSGEAAEKFVQEAFAKDAIQTAQPIWHRVSMTFLGWRLVEDG
jgi:hypothetical protein